MATREQYIDKVENQLREWNRKIDEYKVKAEGKSSELREKFDKKSAELKTKRTELRKKLDQIKNSGEGTFDQLKEDTEMLWHDIKDGYADIKKIVKQ